MIATLRLPLAWEVKCAKASWVLLRASWMLCSSIATVPTTSAASALERRESSSCETFALFEMRVVTLDSGASSSLNFTFRLAVELEAADWAGDCLVWRGLGRSPGLGPSTSAVSSSSDTLQAEGMLSKNIK